MESERDPHLPWFERQKMALLTDLYELTMLIGYLKTGLHERRVAFEFFFRELPPHSGFAVFAGVKNCRTGLQCSIWLTEIRKLPTPTIRWLTSANTWE
ncbi:MAG: hypothetical protein R6T96_10380 [Longimicrobiales bacterium]